MKLSTMVRQVIPVFFLIVLFSSCELFTTRTNTSATTSDLKLIDTIIDFTKVDTYPIFSDCENYAENDNQKACFESSIIEKLSAFFATQQLVVKEKVNDVANVDILIDQSGKARTVTVDSPEIIKEQMPSFDSIIRQSIDALPSMKPAVKRGIFVKSQYRLVVIVRTL